MPASAFLLVEQQSAKEHLFLPNFPSQTSCCGVERGFHATPVEMMPWIFLKQREELSEMMTEVVFATANNSRLDDV